jgi:hypothetical protein
MLALTSSTSGGLSVGIVRLRTKATEFSFFSYDSGQGGLETIYSKRWEDHVDRIVGGSVTQGNLVED